MQNIESVNANDSKAESPASELFIPTIDFSGFGSGNHSLDASIAKQIRTACIDNGFFYVVGHGIPSSETDEIYKTCKEFFSLSVEEKNRVSKANSSCNRGYEPLAAQTLELGAPPDQKEGFYVGVDIPQSDPRVIAGKFNHGPNQWPSEPTDFQAVATRYFAKMVLLGTQLMQALALSLELPRNYFDGFTNDPMCTLRMLHYPPQRPSALPDEKGCGAHTDFGGLTLLWQDSVGGLEVFDKDTGSWIPAPPVDGSFVVNLGDMIQRWTNGLYLSNIHRVINRSGTERYSIPFFFTGNPDHLVSCIESCLQPNQVALLPPITVAEHIQNMYRRTYES